MLQESMPLCGLVEEDIPSFIDGIINLLCVSRYSLRRDGGEGRFGILDSAKALRPNDQSITE